MLSYVVFVCFIAICDWNIGVDENAIYTRGDIVSIRLNTWMFIFTFYSYT